MQNHAFTKPPATSDSNDLARLCVLKIPSVQELLSKRSPLFPFKMTFAEVFSNPLFIFHTSASTGIPKPLMYTRDTTARNMTMVSMDPPSGFESQDKIAVQFGNVMVAPTSRGISSAKGLVDELEKTPADIAFIVPSTEQEPSQSLKLLDFCANNLEMNMYCVGDLPQSIGDVIASKIRLVNQYGASELGLIVYSHSDMGERGSRSRLYIEHLTSVALNDRTNLINLKRMIGLVQPNQQIALVQLKGHRATEDWKYVQFHPDTGAELRPVTNDINELYIEYPTRNLFVGHLSKDKEDLWRWHARADDIIVVLNGEKTNAISMEQYIVSFSQP
ncbi:hypothetical protein MMC29_003037 [Sticta canariensis]|nr:hypothetical protein [Sticta canariensis]